MQPSPKVEDILKLTITDGENPITGATVTIGSDSETSDESGEVEFTLEYGDYTASVSADGYVTATETLQFRSNHKSFTVSLTATGGTGTVTVTCQEEYDGEFYPLDSARAYLLSENAPPSLTNVIAMGETDENGTTLLYEFDGQGHPTQTVKQVPFGDYYLYAEDNPMTLSYSGALTVDGDEEVTITLTPIDSEGG